MKKGLPEVSESWVVFPRASSGGYAWGPKISTVLEPRQPWFEAGGIWPCGHVQGTGENLGSVGSWILEMLQVREGQGCPPHPAAITPTVPSFRHRLLPARPDRVRLFPGDVHLVFPSQPSRCHGNLPTSSMVSCGLDPHTHLLESPEAALGGRATSSFH